MELRFSETDIEHWAKRYQEYEEEKALMGLRDEILKKRVLTKDQLRRVARWKFPLAGAVEKNAEEYVQTITSFALQTPNERARIEVLKVLNGVKWAIASAILHHFHTESYPILDVRALSSVNANPSNYTFDFWWSYVEFCRGIADRAGCTMRTLDRALWQYSKDTQRARSSKQEVP